MQKRKSPKQAVVANRKSGESRLAQAIRTGIPESSLRWIESNDRWPRSTPIRLAHLAALGLSEPAKPVAK